MRSIFIELNFHFLRVQCKKPRLHLLQKVGQTTNSINLENNSLSTLWAEESPNDFDKNHKFKVDAHLVM